MKSIAQYSLPVLAGLALTLTSGPANTLQAGGDSHRGPRKTAVTGYFDWTLVPPNLGPYIIPGTDGDLYLRHLPLAGKFTLAGRGVALEAKIHVDLNGELDVAGTGVVWAPVVLTGTIDGVKTILFEGQGSANEVNLVATGRMTLSGRGPYEGANLEFTFQEIGPGDSNTYTLNGELTPAPRR